MDRNTNAEQSTLLLSGIQERNRPDSKLERKNNQEAPLSTTSKGDTEEHQIFLDKIGGPGTEGIQRSPQERAIQFRRSSLGY